jgi:hypothetical protein
MNPRSAPQHPQARGIVGRNNLTWGRDSQSLAVHLGRDRDPLVIVVPDAIHPRMWRVQTFDGRLSDMTNLTRARDAAMSAALGLLNREQEGQEPPTGAPLVRRNKKSDTAAGRAIASAGNGGAT